MILSGIQWLTDLVHLEIELWNRIDTRLKQDHDLSLALFESLFFISRSHTGSLRVGELADALRITVGATSKLVDRMEVAGLIKRELDTEDRRASRVVHTDMGKHKLASASETYEAEMATVLDSTLSDEEQEYLHNLVTRLLAASNKSESRRTEHTQRQ